MKNKLKIQSLGRKQKIKIAACIMIVIAGIFFVIKAIEYRKAFSITENPVSTSYIGDMSDAEKISIYSSGIQVSFVDENDNPVYGGEFDSAGNGIDKVYLKLVNNNTNSAVIGSFDLGKETDSEIRFSLENQIESFEIEAGGTWKKQITYTVQTTDTSADYSTVLDIKVKYKFDNYLNGDSNNKKELYSTTTFIAHRRTLEPGLTKYSSSETACTFFRKKTATTIYLEVAENLNQIESMDFTKGNSKNDFFIETKDISNRNESTQYYDTNLYINASNIPKFDDLQNRGILTWSVHQHSSTYNLYGPDSYSISIDDEYTGSGNGDYVQTTDGRITFYNNFAHGFVWKNKSLSIVDKNGVFTKPDSTTSNAFYLNGNVPLKNNDVSTKITAVVPIRGGSTSGNPVVNATFVFNIHSYTTEEKMALLNKIINYSGLIESLSSAEAYDEYKDAVRDAYKILNTSKTDSYSITQVSNRLTSAYNKLVKNMMTIDTSVSPQPTETEYVIKHNHIMVLSKDGETTTQNYTQYRVYEPETNFSYNLDYYQPFNEAVSKRSSNESGVLLKNMVVTYYYWDIDFKELKDKLAEAKEYASKDGYTQASISNLKTRITKVENYIDSYETHMNLPEYQNEVDEFVEYLNEGIEQLVGLQITVTFDGVDGTVSFNSKDVKYGDKFGELPTANKPGYELLQWVDEQNNVITSDTIVEATSDIVLFATYTANKYYIYYDLNGGNLDGDLKKQVSYDGSFGALPTPTKTGYILDGWTLEDGTTKVTTTTKYTTLDDITIYAKWLPISYKIKYNGNGSTSGDMDDQTFSYDVAQNLTKNQFVKQGHSFVGWSKNADNNIDFVDEAEVLNLLNKNNQMLTLYAIWDPANYTIRYNINYDGLETFEEQGMIYGEQQKLIATSFTRSGYDLVGWAITPGGEKVYNPQEKITTSLAEVDGEVVNLYAVWARSKFNVTFNFEVDTIDPIEKTIIYGNVYSFINDDDIVASESRTGYSFEGWYIDENCATNIECVDSSKKITSSSIFNSDDDVTLYAKWIPNKYNVKFNGSNPTSGNMEDQGFVYDVSQNLNSNTYVKSGYTFKGWTTTEGSSEVIYVDGESVTNLRDVDQSSVTLYAVWGGNTYTVTLNPDGSEEHKSTFDVTFGQKYTGLTDDKTPSLEGYEFQCWVVSTIPNVCVNKDTTVTIAGNHVLNASYIANEYTIKYDNNFEGSSEASEDVFTYNIEKQLKVSAEPRTGYTFKGWANDPNATVPDYSGGQNVKNLTSDKDGVITLYAVWEANTYIITLKQDDNPQNDTYKSVVYDSNYPELPVLTKSGYEFDGWYLIDGDIEEKVTTSTKVTIADNHILYAKFIPNPVLLFFSLNADDALISESGRYIEYEGLFTNVIDDETSLERSTHQKALPIPIRDGYIFDGWYYSKDGNDKVGDDDIATKTGIITLYAHWIEDEEPIPYTIKYNSNGGIGTMDNQEAIYDNPINLIGNSFTRDGYTFKGWSTSDTATEPTYTDGEEVLNIASTNNEVTLYAVWNANKYTLTLDANEGTVSPTSMEVTYDDNYNLPTPERTGYTFVNWKLDEKVVTNDTIIKTASNHTLLAEWIANNYEVEFKPNFDTVQSMTNQGFIYGETKELSENTYVRTGYDFLGWSRTSTDEEPTYTDKQSVSNLTTGTGTVTLYAIWKVRDITVSFDANEGSVAKDSTIVHYNDLYGDLPTPTREGYNFDGWYTHATVGDKVTALTIVENDSNHTLYAHWSPKKFVVTLIDRETTVAEVDVYYDSLYDLPTNIERTGYTFEGWYTGLTFTTKVENGTVVKLSDNITLYCNWTPNKYKVVFDGNGATEGNMEDQEFTYATSGELNANQYVRTGYTFEGWVDANNDNNRFDNKQNVVNLTSEKDGVVTLKAIWNPITYHISFNGNNGVGSMDTIDVKYDEGKKFPTNTFTRVGYEFTGWKYNGEVYYDESIIPNLTANNNDNIIVEAQWEAYSYTIEFNSNSGTGNMASIPAKYGEMIELPTNTFAKTGYQFIGWSEDEGATEKTINDGDKVGSLTEEKNGTVTLYAVWKANTYTVILDGNGGTPSKDKIEVTYDDVYGDLPSASRPGYNLIGWYTSAEGGEEITSITKVSITGEQKLYAHWTEEDYTYKFIFGDAQTFTEGQVDEYGFKIDGNYSLFTDISIELNNSKVLNIKRNVDYTATEGSTIVNFTSSGLAKLNTLTPNTYNVVVNYSDLGKSVIGTITIVPIDVPKEDEEEEKKEEEKKPSTDPTNPEKDNNNTEENKEENNGNKKPNPSTSDNILLSAIIGLLSLTSIGTMYYKNKKRD